MTGRVSSVTKPNSLASHYYYVIVRKQIQFSLYWLVMFFKKCIEQVLRKMPVCFAAPPGELFLLLKNMRLTSIVPHIPWFASQSRHKSVLIWESVINKQATLRKSITLYNLYNSAANVIKVVTIQQKKPTWSSKK